MKAQWRTWAATIACCAFALVVAPHASVQAMPRGAIQNEITKQEALMNDAFQGILGASKLWQKNMTILETNNDNAELEHMMTEADKAVAKGDNMLAHAHRIDIGLPQDIKRYEELNRKMMKAARLVRSGMLMMVEHEQALSRAHNNMREGHGMLDRTQKIVTALQL